MLAKFRNHGLIALCFFVLTLSQQLLFYTQKGFPIIWLPAGKLLTVYILLLVLTFIKGFYPRLFALSFILILNFFQMSHLSYYGTQILPAEMWLVFTQWHEMVGTLKEEMHHILIPLLYTIIPVGIGAWVLKKKSDLYQTKWVGILFIAYFLYNPARTYITGNTWGRQPSTRDLSGMNAYLSFSYFMGKILPQKLMSKRYSIEENESMKLVLKKSTPKWDQIIFVLGESLTPNHMSLFGYKRSTTPFLDSLKKDKNFYFAKALSSGVSTDISVAFLMNVAYGDAGAIKAAKGQHCLFKLAKEMGHSTHFLSIQSSEQLRYISPYLCAASLDDFRGLEETAPHTVDHQAALDRDLLPHLKTLMQKDGKKFIMLHQRGSHAPWNLRFSPEAAIFKDGDRRINDYDNSVFEFDLFWQALHQELSESKLKTLVIYLSDHGESLGEKGRWGHGFIKPEAFEVPVLIQSFNQELPKRTKKMPTYFAQYNLALYLIHELGWETNQIPETILKDFVIYGNDIDGLAGKARVKYGPLHKYRYKLMPE